MARAELIWPYVEKTLREFLGDRMKLVDTRMVSVKEGSSNIFIRLLDAEEPRLQVFSMMLQGVQETPELLDALNELTAGLAYAKVFWADGDIIVAMELLAESLDRESLNNAVSVIAGAADHLDDELKARFGGETAFPQTTTSEEGTAERARAEGTSEGVGLPPGLEQGESPTGWETPAAEGPGPEEPAAAKPQRDPDESAGYL